MRILGIDPGLQSTGFGLLDVDGQALHYVASGTVRTTEAPRGDLPGRIRLIVDGVAEVIERWRSTGPGWQTRMAERLAKVPVSRAKTGA